MAMAVGVILAAAWPDAGVLKMLAAASAGMLSVVIAFRGHTDYLWRVGGGELVARATSGQYFRISPVSRP